MKQQKESFLHGTLARMIRDTRPIRKWLILSAILSMGDRKSVV